MSVAQTEEQKQDEAEDILEAGQEDALDEDTDQPTSADGAPADPEPTPAEAPIGSRTETPLGRASSRRWTRGR